MLEKLITRIHDLMKLGDPKYIFQIRIHNKHDELTYSFVHFINKNEITQDIKYGLMASILDRFCAKVNKYLNELEAVKYKPKFKIGDIARFGHELHDKKILAIVDTEKEGNQYVVEFINGGDIRLIPMFDVDKYHTRFILKE